MAACSRLMMVCAGLLLGHPCSSSSSARTGPGAFACGTVTNRVECGHEAITAADCAARGCCFDGSGRTAGLFVHAFAAAPPTCFYDVEVRRIYPRALI